jgi:hypothetical protein
VTAFFDRFVPPPRRGALRRGQALRLEDKVAPMIQAELARRGRMAVPRRIVRELWALTPHVYAVNARHDLMSNVAHAIAEGLCALSPAPP